MFDLTTLQLFAFAIFFFSAIAYAALDGFDLGVGCLHLFARTDHERRIFLNAIGPVWDGNSVWIVISMGVLFAAFPKAFASLCSGMYLPVMFLVFSFMFRAAAIEFRSKYETWWWRIMWDIFFFLSSLLLSIDLGMIIGNMIAGVPMDAQGNFDSEKFQFMNAYSFAIGILNLHLFMMHGAIYLVLKTEGELRERLQELTYVVIWAFMFFWVIGTGLTYILERHMFHQFEQYPALLIIAFVAIGSIFSIIYYQRRNAYMKAFLASCFAIALLVLLVGIGLYPHILISTVDFENHSLTIYNSSSSLITLQVIGLVVLTGVPLSVFYMSYLYRVFKGKVEIKDTSY